MPLLSTHRSNDFTKLLVMGNPGTGKTGALASLVAAGYRLRVLDYDNGLEPLKNFILHTCPDRIDQVEYRTLRDRKIAGPQGPRIDGKPRAYTDGVRMLDNWKYDDVDLGTPADWGRDTIFVLDTLTFMAQAAFDYWAPLSKGDGRDVYYNAQQSVLAFLGTLNADFFGCNVIVNSHIQFVDNDDGTRKGFPSAVGSAIAGKIGAYFNSIALCETTAGGKRTIKTVPSGMIDLKNPKPFAMAPSYPIESGLAEFFGVLREPPVAQPKLKRIK